MKKLRRIAYLFGIACLLSFTAMHMQDFPLNGTWFPQRQEIGGAQLPASFYQKQKMVLTDSVYVVAAESVDKGVARYANGKMDIYGREGVNQGKHFTAIYRLENHELMICYDLSGESYPGSFDTKGHPNYFLSIFHKE